MADDVVKIWTKDFGVKRVWVIWFSGGTEGEGGGVNHRQRSVGLFRLTSLSNSRKRRHQKSFQEVHFTL